MSWHMWLMYSRRKERWARLQCKWSILGQHQPLRNRQRRRSKLNRWRVICWGTNAHLIKKRAIVWYVLRLGGYLWVKRRVKVREAAWTKWDCICSMNCLPSRSSSWYRRWLLSRHTTFRTKEKPLRSVFKVKLTLIQTKIRNRDWTINSF